MKKNKPVSVGMPLTLASILFFAAHPALAQEAPAAAADASSAAPQQDGGLEEIVVTAQKR